MDASCIFCCLFFLVDRYEKLSIMRLCTDMKRSLADTNEEGVRIFHKSLQEARQVVGSDLQKNVYRNYNEFVIISKEISNIL